MARTVLRHDWFEIDMKAWSLPERAVLVVIEDGTEIDQPVIDAQEPGLAHSEGLAVLDRFAKISDKTSNQFA